MTQFRAAYRALLAGGELERRVQAAYERLEPCKLCPRKCGARRLSGGAGACRTGHRATVCSFHPHHGEESPLVGSHGSGTIFFSWCNLACRFCQNAELSAEGLGSEVEPEDIASMMLNLQAMGCHNINFVSPSHVVAPILAAVLIAAEAGLRVPLVYNTGGYDSVRTLQLLEGVFDIYMPDMKYADPAVGLQLSGVRDYPDVNQAAVAEMHRQVGELVLDERGVAYRGALVRHLVLPRGLAGTAEICRFLAQRISPNTYVNVMDQYHPCHEACGIPELNRRLFPEEYAAAVKAATDAGLRRFEGHFTP